VKLAAIVPTALVLALVCGVTPSVAHGPTLRPGGPLPLSFEPNQGQADRDVRFLARGRGYGVFLTATETVLVLTAPPPEASIGRRPGPGAPPAGSPSIVRMRLLGADAGATITGLDPLPGRGHYMIGDPGRWRRDVPAFGRVRYTGTYPGVSLVFYGTERQIEYDFVVEPGADPDVVVLAFDGAERLGIDDAGDLVLTTAAGDLRLRRPLIYQDTDGERRRIEGGYVLDGNRVRFRVAAWDPSRPLVIDPALGYSTYLGGTSSDEGLGIAVDAAGNAYVTGSTISSSFPVSSPLQPSRAGVTDVFVTKLDPTGTTLLYSTYLGGSGDDVGTAIAVDDTGSAYVTGTTGSVNFPVLGPFQATRRGGHDAFVSRLAPDGAALVYSTYVGGEAEDFAAGIALDPAGNAYVTGTTASSSFPNNRAGLCNGLKRTGNDAFVVKLSASGSALAYCTLLGGGGDDAGNAIAVDGVGRAWVAGTTRSFDLPLVNELQSRRAGGTDGFVARLDAAGTVVLLSYLGGSGDDEAQAVALDADGNAYLTGFTSSVDFPTVSPLQPALGGLADAFVTKVNAAGSALVFSTYLGGSGNDAGNGIALDPGGSGVYVIGSTGSDDFPTVRAIQAARAGALDVFVTRLPLSGNALRYSTYLGGTGNDVGQAIAVDADGIAYLTGSTASTTFPTVTPIQGRGGSLDAFVTQVADGSVVQFARSAFQFAEGAGSVAITVQRGGDTSDATSVPFTTCDASTSADPSDPCSGTAVAGTDYVTASGTLSFGAGQVTRTFNVTLLDNGLPDCDRTLTLRLGPPSDGAVLGPRRRATLTIADDESSINFSAATYDVAENRGPQVVTVTRCGPMSGTVSVDFTTADPGACPAATGSGNACAGIDYTAVARTLSFAPGTRSRTVTVPITNDRGINLASDAAGVRAVNVQIANVRGGSPPAVVGTGDAVINIHDDDRGGVMAFTAATFKVSESAGVAVIKVSRSGGSGGGATVDFATSDGTAVAGTDYTSTSGTLTFQAGQTSATFSVPITNDVNANAARTVNLTLSGPGPNATTTLGARSTAVLKIVDNELALAFSAPTYSAKENGGSATIAVTLSGVNTVPVTVGFATSDGTARAGSDYTAVSGRLTFSPGGTPTTVRTRSFRVPLRQDRMLDGTRTVNLTLSSPVNAQLVTGPVDRSVAVLSIVDDDQGGALQFVQAVQTVSEAVGSAVVRVRRNRSAGGATVDYTTSDGTASAGIDYMAVSGTLTFGVGETVKTLTVPITNDVTPNGVRTLNVTLSSTAPAPTTTLGPRASTVLRIVDNELALALSASTYAVRETAASARITVQLTGVNTTPVTVDYATTAAGTATPLVDYRSVSGTLRFPPGGTPTSVRTRTFTIPIRRNTAQTGPLTVTLSLTNPVNASFAAGPPDRSTAVLTIQDID
jgi:hypothetical protein